MRKTLIFRVHDLWKIIHMLHELMGRYEDNTLEEFGLTKEQYSILWIIETTNEGNNSLILSDIATKLLRKISSTSTIVNRMEKNGLIKKFRDLPDQREIRIEITPKGKEVLKKSIKPHMTLMLNTFSIYSVEEINTILSLLERLRKKMKAEGYLDIKKLDRKTLNRINQLFKGDYMPNKYHNRDPK